MQSFNNGELLHRLGHFTATTHPSGIDHHVVLAITLHRDIDTVTGSTRHIVNHDAIFTQNTVGQRGFTHVWTTDQGNLDWTIIRSLLRFVFQLFRIDQIAVFIKLQIFWLIPAIIAFIGQLVVLFFFHLGHQRSQCLIDQRRHTTAMRRSNLINLTQTQSVKIGTMRIGIDTVNFVRDYQGWFFTHPQMLGNRLIGGGHAGTGIH